MLLRRSGVAAEPQQREALRPRRPGPVGCWPWPASVRAVCPCSCISSRPTWSPPHAAAGPRPASWRACPSGNAPTTRVRLLTSRFSRSSGLLGRRPRQCSLRKDMYDSVSSIPSLTILAAVGSIITHSFSTTCAAFCRAVASVKLRTFEEGLSQGRLGDAAEVERRSRGASAA